MNLILSKSGFLEKALHYNRIYLFANVIKSLTMRNTIHNREKKERKETSDRWSAKDEIAGHRNESQNQSHK